MVDPVAATDELGGIATRQQLIAAGCSGYDLTRAVRLGRLRRLRQARYATETAPPDAIVAARVGGLLAGASAAKSYGLWGGFDTRVHISVGRGSGRLRTATPPSMVPKDGELRGDLIRRRIRLHWLDGGATPELGPECWRVPLETCLRQVVAWCDRETAVACLDTAATILRVDVPSIFARASLRSRLVAAASRPGSESGTESLVRQRLLAAGVRVRQQVRIAGVGRVDMGVVGTRIVIEIDSSWHETPEARAEDYRRDAELLALGYTVIRLSYAQVTGEWPWCERMILAAIASR